MTDAFTSGLIKFFKGLGLNSVNGNRKRQV